MKVQKTNKYMKKHSTSLAIMETQIKSTLRFHLTLVRMTIIKKTKAQTCQVPVAHAYNPRY
jgi:hypothetical protein